MGAWNDKLLMLQLINQSYYITPRGMQGVKKDGFFRYDETPNPLGQWSWLLKKNPGPNDGICDPDGDPYPDKPDSVDPLDSVVRQFEWVCGYSNHGAVEGNVFRKDGTYYVVFDGSELRDWYSDWLSADGDILLKDDDFIKYLEEAYRFYEKAKSKYKNEGFNEKM